jgi:hypothetical protein
MIRIFSFVILILLVLACNKEQNDPGPDEIFIDSLFVNNNYIAPQGSVHSIDFADVETLDTTLFDKQKFTITGGIDTNYFHKFHNDLRNMTIRIPLPLDDLSVYRIVIEPGSNFGKTIRGNYYYTFYTGIDKTPKFPQISDDSLLTLIQKNTFAYFRDYRHPVSGLSRDRLGGGDIVTSGGSGFGIMAIITGIERGFITREEGFEQIRTMVNFLINPATEKFHGAFPHWLNGTTGRVQPFSQKDNGGDLVETAFLMQGLLTAKQYFLNGNAGELALCDSIVKLWEAVEWDWYRNDNQNKLFWHWSPNYAFEMNMPVQGWNEALIVYILAASSPTHSIPKEVYDQGWARNGTYPMINGSTYFGINLHLGETYGGPLFFAHYSFLGLDPRNLSDQYANYWTQNTAHAKINYHYCLDNPRNYPGYGAGVWGLTASDIPNGYSASSPVNDLGVIAPTGAVSSIPYTPAESMEAVHFYYYILGDRLWGDYGFYDAFSIKDRWFASSYLAIDQGPIICMIENHRTGLLWELFMINEEAGLTKLGFNY